MNDEPKVAVIGEQTADLSQAEDPMEAMRVLVASTSNRATRCAADKRLRQEEKHAARYTRSRR